VAADCVAGARKISATLDGREWRETLNAVAASGLAQLKEGRLFGVTRQRNTALLGVPASQVFTHLNMNNLRCVKSFKKTPDAVLVAFRNRALDWERDELLVVRPGLTRAEVSRVISLDAVGIADVAQIQEYFELYLNAAYHRDYTFSFQIWFEGLACEVGDILAINHMMISSLMASARIVEIERNGSNEIIAVTLDAAQEPNDETGLEAILDLSSLENIFAQGVKIGATIVTGLGATTQPISAVSNVTKRITFEVPFINDAVLPEHMVVLGERGQEALRVEVTKIQAGDNLSFNITAVPEAPQIWG
jgi:predicted phage tail protein